MGFRRIRHMSKMFGLILSVWITMIMSMQAVNATDINLTGSQNADLSASLSWSLSNNTNNDDYSYQLQESDITNNKTSTIGTKDSIKVLNITPWSSTDSHFSSLKTWMVDSGYGQGKISVDTVYINDFSKNANGYLKDSAGNYKYDVIVFGFEDCNAYLTISQDAVSDVLAYANTGRGVLMGHDTTMAQLSVYGYNPDGTQFSYPSYSLQSFPFSTQLGIELTSASSFGQTWYTGSDGSLLSKVKLLKNGYLIDYPNVVGKVGDILTIPHSHVSGQWTQDKSSVWADFVDQNGNSYPALTTAKFNVRAGADYNSSFDQETFSADKYEQFAYLITKNNWGLIQTGHANGQATSDEQKLIANTLFYLGQVTSDTKFTTHTSQDVEAPDVPTLTQTYDPTTRKVTVNNLSSTDHGNQYSYQVIGTNLNDNSTVKSNAFAIECKTGVKKYLYSVDQNKNGTIGVSASKEITNGQAVTLPDDNQNYYLHVAALDGNDNISGSTTYFVDGTKPTLTDTDDLQTVTHSAQTLHVTAADADSGVDSIQTPDGVWHSGSSVNYPVSQNGSYTFAAKDKVGNMQSQTIAVNNIYPETFVQNSTKTQVADQTQAQSASFSNSVALSGVQQTVQAVTPDWLIGNSSGYGWLLSVSAPALSSGTHKLTNALSMKAPSYSGGMLTNLLGSGYQQLNDDASAVSVYQNKPTTFTWTQPSGTYYLRVNSYVNGQSPYTVSNVKISQAGTSTNLLQNADGPFIQHGGSTSNDSNAIDNYEYYEDSTVKLEQGKTYTLSAQTNGVFGADHYVYRTDLSNTNAHNVIWLSSAPYPTTPVNQIVSDDYTDSTVTSKLKMDDGSTYQIKVPANAYAGTYQTQIKWSVN